MSTRIPFQWNTANFDWSAVSPTDGKTYPPNETVTGTNRWDDCALIVDLVNIVGGGGDPNAYLKKHSEKKKQFIKILCQVEGIEYKETKEVLSRKISITHVALVAKEVLGIDLKINM